MNISLDVHMLRNVAQSLKTLKMRAKKDNRYKDILTIEKIEKSINKGFC